jgi:predicted ATPase/DNA-binding SARP family transcriptional activator
VEFRILGPLQVLDAGRELTLGSPKERALLAILLLNAGEVVSRERLIDGIWGDSPPPTAGRALNVHVSQLRKSLARNGCDAIATRPRGYTLNVDREQLDAARFEQLVADARARVASGDVQAASSLLRQALALWGGPALAGVELESTAQNETRRLDDLRLAAQVERIDCDLSLGLHEEVIPELETLVAEHPLHERLRGQHMLALYRAGRQAAALASYQEARRTLTDELGLEPGVALQRLERAILNHDPALEAPVRDAGAVTATRIRESNLPLEPTPLVGRRRELTEVIELVRANRFVTLTGAGGCGKTRLALRAAHELVEAFDDGVWFVPLAALRDSELVLPTIAHTLGVDEPQMLVEHLRAKELLLVLDNFEQLLDASLPVARLLTQAPRLRVVVTSRAILRLAAEHVYPVPPLAIAEAVALFVERARAVLPAFEPDEHMARVCERLDNLPLAIELAAAQVNLLSPAALLARLERRLPLPPGGARDAPARQQTLRATIEWSYDLLTPDARELFARLAVFARGWTLEAAESVCQARIELLAELVDRNLVRQRRDRFSMLETIREYALDQHEAREDAVQLHHSHADWCVRHAQALRRQRRGEGAAVTPLRTFELELDNFRAALRFLLEQGDHVRALELASSLYRLWRLGGYATEGRRWLEQGLSATGAVPPLLRARALRVAGALARDQGDYVAGEALLAQSLSLSRGSRNSGEIAAALNLLASVCAVRGEYERARDHLTESLSLYEAAGDASGSLRVYHSLATLAGVQGDLATARQLHEDNLRRQRSVGDLLGVASTLQNLGYVAVLQRDEDAAEAFLTEGFELARELGYKGLKATIQTNLARLAIRRGRLRDAQQYLAEALPVLNQYGARRECAECFQEFASIAARCGQPLRAARLLAATAAVRNSAGHAIRGAEQALLDRLTTDVRHMMDADQFHGAWQEGEAQGFDEMITYALEPIDLNDAVQHSFGISTRQTVGDTDQ